ncbi:hypothetical protein IMZ29_09155 [Achromobacter sp. GG226]|uniref:hypothetical protein n=1 Tax=Verticiella alkaliphila TaxID=2779529 RepID=UPI001C0E2775|nr:hypothetical protein [Verticiella sp. GG226]MBU4610695.1 hypothetical protein [Verticiella sp. GG226]
MPHPALSPDRYVAAGSAFAEYFPDGTLLVCTSGSLTLRLPAIDLAESTLRPTLRLHVGETCQLDAAGWVQATAIEAAQLRVVSPSAAPLLLVGILTRLTRRMAGALRSRRADTITQPQA